MGMFLRRGPAPHRTRMSDLEIGRSIKLNLNGTPWEWLVVHQGLPSSIYDTSCDGSWLLMKDIYENHVWSSSGDNKYESSDIHAYLNDAFLNLFDSNIKDAIKYVKIPYYSNGTGQSGANGLSCKIFLLSGYEVGWTTSDNSSFRVDGAKLSYFESGTGASANNKRVANYNGSATGWWLRSPYVSQFIRNSAWYVSSNGVYSYNYASYSHGIRPAIILPSDMIVTDDMLAA